MEKRANQQSEDSPTEEKSEDELLQESAENQEKKEHVSANGEHEKTVNEETPPTIVEKNEAGDINLNTEGSEKVEAEQLDGKTEDRESLISNLPGL